MPPWLGAVASGAVLLAGLARGFARDVHPYALSQYQYTYDSGFLIRGLPGELAELACGRSVDCLARLVDVVGTCSVLAFTVGLWLFVQARTRAAPAASVTLIAIGSGPLLVQIGAARGYHDPLTLTLGLAAYWAFLERHALASVLLFGIGLLTHELVAVYMLPVFVLPLLASLRERATLLRQLAVVLTLSVAAVVVVRAGHADRVQRRDIASRLAQSATLARGWRYYRAAGVAAARIEPESASTRRLSYLERPALFPYLAPLAGALMLVLGLLIARGQALWFPVYAALLLAPLTILLVAWDVERLVTLAGTTALMVCLAVEERCRIRQAPLYALAATLALASVGLTARYKEVNRFAYDGMLLGPERHRR